MKTKNILIFTLLALMFTSCYEEESWLDENTTTENRHFPVIAEWMFAEEIADTLEAGTNATLDLRYWSIDPISEIQLLECIDGSEMVVESKPYVQNFNEQSQTDQLLFDYTFPVVSDTTEIILKARVINQNGLIRTTDDGSSSTRPSITVTVLP